MANSFGVDALYFNEDYEPYAKLRDKKIRKTLESNGIECHQSKDHVIFSGTEVCKSDESAYVMFTPYKNAWLKKLTAVDYSPKEINKKKFVPAEFVFSIPPLPSLKKIGFDRSNIPTTPLASRKSAINNLKDWSKNLYQYQASRDFPELGDGTSKLSVHLRFGTISIRECVRVARGNPTPGAQVWLSELIWRDFYQMILDQFPHVAKGSFKKHYDKIKWIGSESHFRSWREGHTGFPIVDAGMRQLNQTGWMHNRLRMITASFLVKDLLVDWKKGEAYFAEKLLDYDLGANNGGWQWCASTGCDAQPYFRIFNPVLQSQKFDPECKYIKKWVPELKSLSPKQIHSLSLNTPQVDYPEPIVSHSQQKMRVLKMYQAAVK